MKWFDYYLQKRRFETAGRQITPRSSLLDIGCNGGEFFLYLEDKEIFGTGIDPDAESIISRLPPDVSLIKEAFPSKQLIGRKYDFISVLAVFEHIQKDDQKNFAEACYQLLSDNGKLIITVPSPFVDQILYILRFFRLIHAMSLEQHYGFNPRHIGPLFYKAGFKLVLHKKFELRLNNIFVFAKNN